MQNQSKIKLKNWKHLKEVSTTIIIDNKEVLIAPMGAHGLKNTRVILDEEDKIKQDLKLHNDNKWSKEATIVLIGTNY